jgi:hypothetical protein
MPFRSGTLGSPPSTLVVTPFSARVAKPSKSHSQALRDKPGVILTGRRSYRITWLWRKLNRTEGRKKAHHEKPITRRVTVTNRGVRSASGTVV